MRLGELMKLAQLSAKGHGHRCGNFKADRLSASYSSACGRCGAVLWVNATGQQPQIWGTPTTERCERKRCDGCGHSQHYGRACACGCRRGALLVKASA